MYASHVPTLGRRMIMTDEREITKDNIIFIHGITLLIYLYYYIRCKYLYIIC